MHQGRPGALQSFHGWDLELFVIFLPTRGQWLVRKIEPLTVKSLDQVPSRVPYHQATMTLIL